MMSRKVICDLNLISVDFGREEEKQPGHTFRITFRHLNGHPTGTIEVDQGEADHFAVQSMQPRNLASREKTQRCVSWASMAISGRNGPTAGIHIRHGVW